LNRKVFLTAALLIAGAVFSSAAYCEDFAAPDDAEIQRAEFHQFKGHHCSKCGLHPSKEEMEKKKAEVEKRLKLTEEQKLQIEKKRKEGHEKIKPIFKEKQEKTIEIKKIFRDEILTLEQKKEKIAPLKEDIKKLNEQADALRKENMRYFENILTDKQKKEFAKIKAEQKKAMKKSRAAFKKIMKKAEKERMKKEQYMLPYESREDFLLPPKPAEE